MLYSAEIVSRLCQESYQASRTAQEIFLNSNNTPKIGAVEPMLLRRFVHHFFDGLLVAQMHRLDSNTLGKNV
jgi:hypothetical protein